MKKLLVLLSVLIISHAAYAQMDGTYNNSVGLQVFGVSQVPKIFNESTKEKYINTYFSGAMIKFNDNQISYRISGNYFNKDISFNDIDATKGKMTDYAFKVGFEKNFNYSRIQPYFLMDLGYRSNTFDGTINTTTNANISKSGVLLAPGFGLKLNVQKAITLFAEANLEFYYFQGKDDTSVQGSDVHTTSKYYRSQFLLNPITAGLQFHFGSNN